MCFLDCRYCAFCFCKRYASVTFSGKNKLIQLSVPILTPASLTTNERQEHKQRGAIIVPRMWWSFKDFPQPAQFCNPVLHPPTSSSRSKRKVRKSCRRHSCKQRGANCSNFALRINQPLLRFTVSHSLLFIQSLPPNPLSASSWKVFSPLSPPLPPPPKHSLRDLPHLSWPESGLDQASSSSSHQVSTAPGTFSAPKFSAALARALRRRWELFSLPKGREATQAAEVKCAGEGEKRGEQVCAFLLVPRLTLDSLGRPQPPHLADPLGSFWVSSSPFPSPNERTLCGAVSAVPSADRSERGAAPSARTRLPLPLARTRARFPPRELLPLNVSAPAS